MSTAMHSVLVALADATAGTETVVAEKDSAAGRAVFIGMTLAIIVAGVILSVRYKKR